MKNIWRILFATTAAFAVLLLVMGALATQAATSNIPEAVGGFIYDGEAITLGSGASSTPSLALNPNTPDDAPSEPWVAFAENGRVAVATYNQSNQTWEPHGEVLNLDPENEAGDPSLAFRGLMPWVAFVEMVGPTQQILAARYRLGAWSLTGDNGSSPTLNHDPAQDAANPAVAVGPPLGGILLPWAVWEEQTSNATHIFASRAIADDTALGGFRWQPTGGALNYDPQRDGTNPDLTFSGADETVAWAVWSEGGNGRPDRIFAAMATADASAPGGFAWNVVGNEAGCGSETACALNFNTNHNAAAPRIASGLLPGETTPSPWVVFAETGANGVNQVYVKRLDGDHFRSVGGSLNVSASENATNPDIYFVGNVPHVAWTEVLTGESKIFVRHLADARPGQERWDLDTFDGLSRPLSQAADHATLGSDGATPYVAWEEDGVPASIYAAHRSPEHPAWGSNYPPYIRVISGNRGLLSYHNPVTASRLSSQPPEPVVITTSCDHVNGWDSIAEIHFQLSDESGRILLGKYVAAENKVYVEDPDNPSTFLGGFTPGEGQDIETDFVTLHVPDMSITNHGTEGAALDIEWVLTFKEPTFPGDYVQSINIFYESHEEGNELGRTGEQVIIETGFFRVGRMFAGAEYFMPLVVRN